MYISLYLLEFEYIMGYVRWNLVISLMKRDDLKI